LITLLMYNHMRYNPGHSNQAMADRLVLSGGYACPIVYAAAADLGLAIAKTRSTATDDVRRCVAPVLNFRETLQRCGQE